MTIAFADYSFMYHLLFNLQIVVVHDNCTEYRQSTPNKVLYQSKIALCTYFVTISHNTDSL